VKALDFTLTAGSSVGDAIECAGEMRRERQDAQSRGVLCGEPPREVATRAAIQIEIPTPLNRVRGQWESTGASVGANGEHCAIESPISTETRGHVAVFLERAIVRL